MARPRKTGLDYFPFDCDFFDDRIMIAISGEFGTKGEIVTVKLLCEIYRHNYFVEWDELLKFKLAHHCQGVSPELIDQIVHRLVKWGFFDSALFDTAKVLTSVDIQERYFNVAKYRITARDLPYLLVSPYKNYTRMDTSAPSAVKQGLTAVSQCEINITPQEAVITHCETPITQPKNTTGLELTHQSGSAGGKTPPKIVDSLQKDGLHCETPITHCETPITQKIKPQSKVNKIKEKRKNSLSRVKKNAVTGICPAPTLLEVEKFFKENQLAESSPVRFFNYYESRGWKSGKSPVVDWKALAITWNTREDDFNNKKSTEKQSNKRPKTEMEQLKKLEGRKAREKATKTAQERAANPEGLTPAEILAQVKIRHGLDPTQSLAEQSSSVFENKTDISHCEMSVIK